MFTIAEVSQYIRDSGRMFVMQSLNTQAACRVEI